VFGANANVANVARGQRANVAEVIKRLICF